MEYIAGSPIFELCTKAERRDGSSRFLSWWDQDHSQAEEGVEFKKKENSVFNQRSGGSSLVFIGKVETLIHTL